MVHKKLHLPKKPCAYCKRDFNWRKKWNKIWEEVKFCSKKCKKLYQINKN